MEGRRRFIVYIEEGREGNKKNGEFLRKSLWWSSWCPFIVILNSFYQILEIYHFGGITFTSFHPS